MENQQTGDLVAQVFRGREGWEITIPNASQMTVLELAALMGRFKCNAEQCDGDTLVLWPLDPEAPAPDSRDIAEFYIQGCWGKFPPLIRATPIYRRVPKAAA